MALTVTEFLPRITGQGNGAKATSATVAVGSVIVVAIGAWISAGVAVTATITDDAGNTYFLAGASPSSTSWASAIYYAFVTTQLNSGANITIASETQQLAIHGVYISGASGTFLDIVVGAQSGTNQTSATLTSGALTEPSQVLLFVGNDSNGFGTFTTTFTKVGTASDSNSIFYKVVSSRSSVVENLSWTTGTDYTFVMCSFMAYPFTAAGARRFNGTTDYISAALPSGISTSAFSTSIWVNPIVVAAAATYKVIHDQRDGSGNANAFVGLSGNGVQGNLAWYFDGAVNAVDPGTATLTAGNWYNLVATAGASGLATFVNGVSDGTAAGAISMTWGTNPFVFGVRNLSGSLDRFLNAKLADFAVWNVVLTAGEIAALKAGARPGTIRPASLAMWLPLEGQNTPEPDLSGLKNNGTLSGTAGDVGPPFGMFTPRWPQFTEIAVAGGPFMVFNQQTLAIPLQTTMNITIGVHS